MKKDQLARLLAAAVAIPVTVTNAACECPHTDVVEEEQQTLSAEDACDAARSINEYFDPYGGFNSACGSVCGNAKYNLCALDQAYMDAYRGGNPEGGGGGDGGGGSGGGGGVGPNCPSQTATLTCQVGVAAGQQHSWCPIPGRRPAGLVEEELDRGAVGRFLASSAHFEAAAVIAFERLGDELAALGAPRDLLDDVARAAQDEVRHAAVMARLASAHGAEVGSPRVAPAVPRTALEIAVENAMEGLVNETFAAATALFQARYAEDPRIRTALAAIADDECAHAALAHRIASFLAGHLSDAERAVVEARRHEAVFRLAATLEEPAPEVRSAAGVPTRAEAIAVYRRMCRAVWRAPEGPCPSAERGPVHLAATAS